VKSALSTEVPTAVESGCQKLGQPVPLSYLVSEENSGRSHPAQAKLPLRFSAFSGLVPARSVPCLRSTSYCAGVSRRRHSSSLFSTSNFFAGAASVVAPQRKRENIASVPAGPSNIARLVFMTTPSCPPAVQAADRARSSSC